MQYFHVKTDVLMERDLAAGVVHLLDKEGSRNVLVFADEHVAQHPAVAKMLSAAGEPGRKIELRSIPSGEPTTGLVNELAGSTGAVGWTCSSRSAGAAFSTSQRRSPP